MLRHDMLDHPSYLDLGPLARAMLIGIGRKHDSFNNGRIGYGDLDVKKEGLARNNVTIRKGFEELCEHGFIELVRLASYSPNLDEASARRVSEWRLTFFKTPNGPATNDFQRWRPGEQVYRLTARTRSSYRGLEQPQVCSPKTKATSYPRLEVKAKTPRLAVDASSYPRSEHIIYHGEGRARADASDCMEARNLCLAWIDRVGWGARRQLARQSQITEDKLSKFLSPNGRGRTLPKADLARLIDIVSNGVES